MPAALQQRTRALGAALSVLLLLAACATKPPGIVNESHASFNRTFDTAHGAMADLKMTVSEQDRRRGRLVGSLGLDTIVATVEPRFNDTIRVTFAPQGLPVDDTLPQRLVDAYHKRMSGATILPGNLLR